MGSRLTVEASQSHPASVVVRMIAGMRLPLTSEKAMQQALADHLRAARIPFDREHRLSAGDVVDFLLDGGIAVECKLRAPKRAIYRQLCRYAEHPDVHAVVLVSNTAMGLPDELEGKPAYYVGLGAAWL